MLGDFADYDADGFGRARGGLAQQVLELDDARRHRLPCRSGTATYWQSGPRPGHATISDATQWHHAHRGPRCGKVLADIDTNHGNCSVQCLGHGVLLVLAPLPSAGGAGARPDDPINGAKGRVLHMSAPGPHHQCAFSTASTDVTPAIIEPVIATSAGTPRGNSRLISEAMKIAAMGRAMTK